MAGKVQLGLLRLELSSGPSSLDASWSILTLERLICLEVVRNDMSVYKALLNILGDPGVGFSGECRTDERGCLIRVCLTPLDVKGSTWRRTGGSGAKRTDYLKTIFGRVKEGWDAEGGRYLMDSMVGLLVMVTVASI